MAQCKCGCGEDVRRGRVFVDRSHQTRWQRSKAAKANRLPDTIESLKEVAASGMAAPPDQVLKSPNPSSIKIVGAGLFYLAIVVWAGGAFFAGMYFNFDQKRQCIQDEGWLKGYLWCSAEDRNTFAGNMLKGVFWPLYLLNWTQNGSSSISDATTLASVRSGESPPTLTDEAFRASRVGMMYTCWGLALRTDQLDAADTVAKIISILRSKDQALNELHDQYLTMAGLSLGDIEKKYGLQEYYNRACSEPVENMRRGLAQGMLQ